MTAVISMIVVAVVLAACMVVLAVRGGLSIGTGDANESLQPVHLPALMNLLDESQQDYLRTRLSKQDFAKLQRQRNKALLVYVKRIASNSAVLMRHAHAATQVSDMETAAAGGENLPKPPPTPIYPPQAKNSPPPPPNPPPHRRTNRPNPLPPSP